MDLSVVSLKERIDSPATLYRRHLGRSLQHDIVYKPGARDRDRRAHPDTEHGSNSTPPVEPMLISQFAFPDIETISLAIVGQVPLQRVGVLALTVSPRPPNERSGSTILGMPPVALTPPTPRTASAIDLPQYLAGVVHGWGNDTGPLFREP